MPATGPALVLALASALLPASHAAQSAQDSAAVDVIAGRADTQERMTVPVRLGTKGPFRFLLDTGAETTVLSSSLAAGLTLPMHGRAMVTGVAGSLEAETVRIEELRLGRRSAFGLIAPLLAREHIGGDGIVGLDSLQGQRVVIDFARNLIAIDDAPALGGDRGFDIIVRARRRSGQLIMTDALVQGIKVDVVIDTGAQASIGNRALQRALARRSGQREAMLTSVTGQEILAEVGLVRDFRIGTVTLGNVGIAYAASPAFVRLKLDRRPALLLGMRELRAFRRVAIDFASRKVLFDLPPEF